MSIENIITDGIKKSKKVVSTLKNKLLLNLGNNGYRRFIVLSRSRTGSNMLISFLDSHPNICAAGEIFSNLNEKNYKDILSKAFAKQPFHVKAKGFKIFYYHPIDDKSCGIWDDLVALDDLYVIHLKRKNILHTLISRKIAGIKDVWFINSADRHSEDERKKLTVTFTVDELREGFKQTREWEEIGDKRFRNHPLISIYYEDLVNDRESTFRKVTEFLGVRYIEPNTTLKKQNSKSMSESVANYEELKLAFSDTEYQTFFVD
jgi:LPS sulfotransferase NodH